MINRVRESRSDAVDSLFRVSQEIGTDNQNKLLSIAATWLLREAHLAVERAYAMMESGIPEETAWFLAIDDIGFQLAHAAANEGWPGK